MALYLKHFALVQMNVSSTMWGEINKIPFFENKMFFFRECQVVHALAYTLKISGRCLSIEPLEIERHFVIVQADVFVYSSELRWKVTSLRTQCMSLALYKLTTVVRQIPCNQFSHFVEPEISVPNDGKELAWDLS